MTVTESIVRNCLICHSGGKCFEVREHGGDIVIKYPGPGGGVIRRSRKGASGDIYIPMEDGREIRLDLAKLFAA